MPGVEATAVNIDQQVRPSSDVSQFLATSEVPDGTIPEMPASHPDVDLKNLTVDGLIKVCKYFEAIAAENPQLAKTQGQEVIKQQREQAAMREKGVSDAEIKAQVFLSMRERRKERAKAKQKQDEQTEQVRPDLAEQSMVAAELAAIQTAQETTDINVATLRRKVERRPEPTVSERAQKKPPDAVVRVGAEEIEQAASLQILDAYEVIEQATHAAAQELLAHRIADQASDVLLEAEPGDQNDLALVAPEYVVPLNKAVLAGEVSELAEAPQDASVPGLYEMFTGMEVDFVSEELVAPQLDWETELTKEAREFLSPEVAETWRAELAKEPLEIYEDFAVGLRQFAESFLVDAASEESESPYNADEPEAGEVIVVPPIVLVVAERLAELAVEEQTAVGVILKDIVGAMHGLELLEAREADDETVAVIDARLEELCVTLFEALGIEYDEEAVRQFVAVLRDPEFKPAPSVVVALDLERSGTHEVKRRFAQLASGLSLVEHRLQQAIGGLALSAPHLADLLAAS